MPWCVAWQCKDGRGPVVRGRDLFDTCPEVEHIIAGIVAHQGPNSPRIYWAEQVDDQGQPKESEPKKESESCES